MAFLIIDGLTVPVHAEGATFSERITIGSRSRSYSGAARSTVRATKIVMKVRTRNLDNATWAPIRDAILPGDALAITGDIGGYTALVTIGEQKMSWINGALRVMAELTIEQV